MENLTSRFDTSSWYYGWTLQKARARDGVRDYIVRAQDNVHVANLSVKKWFMGLRDVVQKLYLYIEQSWLTRKLAEAVNGMSDESKVYGYTVLSCFFFAICSLFTDLIKGLPIIEILWWRFFFTLALTSLINLYKGYPTPMDYPKTNMILLTALLGTLTAMSTVFALRHLPIGEATLLLTTAPIFTVVLSYFFLKEKLLIWDILALATATLGVFFVAQPSIIFGNDNLSNQTPIFYISIVVALGRGFLKAAKYVAVSCTGVEVPTSVIVMCLSCLGFLVSTLFLIISVCVEQISDKDMNKTWVHPSILNFTCLWMVGVMYCLQQLCVCKAMQYGQPGKTSLLKYLDVVLPFVFQFVIFREFPNTWTLVGCACIALSTVSVIIVKRVKPIKHVKFRDEPTTFGETEEVDSWDSEMVRGGVAESGDLEVENGAEHGPPSSLPTGQLTLK